MINEIFVFKEPSPKVVVVGIDVGIVLELTGLRAPGPPYKIRNIPRETDKFALPQTFSVAHTTLPS